MIDGRGFPRIMTLSFTRTATLLRGRSYNIGPCKKFLEAYLDGLYKSAVAPSTLDNVTIYFPQGSTGATFAVNVGKSEEEFEPKLEMKGSRKRELKAAKAEKTATRKLSQHDRI